jgi:hypothetical protein
MRVFYACGADILYAGSYQNRSKRGNVRACLV